LGTIDASYSKVDDCVSVRHHNAKTLCYKDGLQKMNIFKIEQLLGIVQKNKNLKFFGLQKMNIFKIEQLLGIVQKNKNLKFFVLSTLK
jgi:hypothetical protein